MTTILAALSCAVLWSGRPRAVHRLRSVVPIRGRPPTRLGRWPIALIGLGCVAACGGVYAALASAIVIGVLGWRSRRRKRHETAEGDRDDLLTALSLMIAELSVGAPPARACAVAAREMSGANSSGVDSSGVNVSGMILSGRPSAVARSLSVLAGRAELGGTVGADETPPGSDAQSWRRITIAWQTSDRYGLPLVDLLESVRADLLARRAFVERTRAGLAGPRATATVLAGLPVLGIALGQVTGAQPLQTLLGGGLGGILLVTGTALAAAGLVWSDLITDKVLLA